MPQRIGISDAKTHLSELVRQVSQTGRRIIITRQGEDVAQLGPLTYDDDELPVRRVMMRGPFGTTMPGPPIIEDLDAGR